MNQPYAVWEVMLYAFLDSFPYMMLGLFAFRDCLRFKKRLTAMLLALVEVLFVALVTISLMTRRIPMDIVDIVLSLLYIGFTFLVIREHPGKLLFTVLVLLNLGNLCVVCGKCLEGQLFPELALQVYRYTFFLCKLPLQAILLPLSYLLIFRDIRSSGEEDDAYPTQQAAQHWKYLWVVPGVFYLIWMLNFYNSTRTVLENIMDPASSGFLLLIDACSVLIYRLIVDLANTYRSNARLQRKNQSLELQTMQYESLSQRIDDERRARHDLRHHMVVLQGICTTHDWAALEDYVAQYVESTPLDQPALYCENIAANALIAFFSQQAQKQGIRFDAQVALPESVPIGKIDLSVILGNLLENAVEACTRQRKGDRYIRVQGSIIENKLLLAVENSCDGVPRLHPSGAYRSSKRDGPGIGISSVRDVVAHYNGVCQIDARNSVFTAKVLLYI